MDGPWDFATSCDNRDTLVTKIPHGPVVASQVHYERHYFTACVRRPAQGNGPCGGFAAIAVSWRLVADPAHDGRLASVMWTPGKR